MKESSSLSIGSNAGASGGAYKPHANSSSVALPDFGSSSSVSLPTRGGRSISAQEVGGSGGSGRKNGLSFCLSGSSSDSVGVGDDVLPPVVGLQGQAGRSKRGSLENTSAASPASRWKGKMSSVNEGRAAEVVVMVPGKLRLGSVGLGLPLPAMLM